MYCSKCGTLNPEDANFCRDCGTPLSVLKSEGITATNNPLLMKCTDRQMPI